MTTTSRSDAYFNLKSLENMLGKMEDHLTKESEQYARLLNQFKQEAKTALTLTQEMSDTFEQLINSFLQTLLAYHNSLKKKLCWLKSLLDFEKMEEFIDRVSDIKKWYIEEGAHMLSRNFNEKMTHFLASAPPPNHPFESVDGIDFYLLKSCVMNFPSDRLEHSYFAHLVNSCCHIAKRVGQLPL